MRIINAYTDGSAVVAGKMKGRGGFGTYFPNLFGRQKAFSLGFWNTKTGRMEVTALLYAIKAIKSNDPIQLHVYSDSQYVTKTFTEKRLEKWISNNWKTYNYKREEVDVKNVDLWKKVLFELNNRPKLKLVMHHIKGHQIDKIKDPIKKALFLKENPHVLGNTIADKFADYKRFSEEELKNDL